MVDIKLSIFIYQYYFHMPSMPRFWPLSLLYPPMKPRWGWQTSPVISQGLPSLLSLLHSSANERIIFSIFPVLTSNTRHSPSSAARNRNWLLGLMVAARKTLPCLSSLLNDRNTAPVYDIKYACSHRGITIIVFCGVCRCRIVWMLFDPTIESLSWIVPLPTEVGMIRGLISRIGSAVLPSHTFTVPSALPVITASKLLPSGWATLLLPPRTPSTEWGRTM